MNLHAKKAIDRVLGIEKGFSDHPSDPGGETKYGITEKKAREHGYEGDMRDLPVDFARHVYEEDYWDALSLDMIAHQSQHLAYEIFEFGVNSGIVRAGKSFQRSLNAFNKGGEYYDDLVVDGKIGPKTLEAWKEFLYMRGGVGVNVLIKAINSLQGAYYIEITEGNPNFEEFTYGWIKERVEFNFKTDW